MIDFTNAFKYLYETALDKFIAETQNILRNIYRKGCKINPLLSVKMLLSFRYSVSGMLFEKPRIFFFFEIERMQIFSQNVG